MNGDLFILAAVSTSSGTRRIIELRVPSGYGRGTSRLTSYLDDLDDGSDEGSV